MDTPAAADDGKVSTADEGDIGRGTHQAAPIEAGDPSDVVPNLVMPDDTSGQDQLKHYLTWNSIVPHNAGNLASSDAPFVTSCYKL